MPIKNEMHYIIIRWKGGKMKEDAVNQCPSRRMDMQECQTDELGIACVPPTQFGSYRMSFRGHLPTEGLCTYVTLC